MIHSEIEKYKIEHGMYLEPIATLDKNRIINIYHELMENIQKLMNS